jgi:hypothetical protein
MDGARTRWIEINYGENQNVDKLAKLDIGTRSIKL